jgi:hypothetical protein
MVFSAAEDAPVVDTILLTKRRGASVDGGALAGLGGVSMTVWTGSAKETVFSFGNAPGTDGVDTDCYDEVLFE